MKANIATRPMSAAPAWRTRLVWLAIQGLFLEQRDEAPELDAALLEVIVGVEARAGGREKDDVAGLGAGHRRLERLGQRRQAVDGEVGGLRGAGEHRPRPAEAEEGGGAARRPHERLLRPPPPRRGRRWRGSGAPPPPASPPPAASSPGRRGGGRPAPRTRAAPPACAPVPWRCCRCSSRRRRRGRRARGGAPAAGRRAPPPRRPPARCRTPRRLPPLP